MVTNRMTPEQQAVRFAQIGVGNCACTMPATIAIPRPAQNPDTGQTRWYVAHSDGGRVRFSDLAPPPEDLPVRVTWLGGMQQLCGGCWRGYCLDFQARPATGLYPSHVMVKLQTQGRWEAA